MQQHVLPLETSNLPYQGCLTRRRSTKCLWGKNQVRPAIISLKWEVNWENWVIYFDALVTSQTEVNLTIVILVDSFLCLYHSTPKVKFVFLQSNSNLFRYEEVQRVSGLLLIASIFESISSLFFTTGPSVGKIGHMRKSVAFEAFKVQTIPLHKMSEIYTIRPPKEITRSKW